MRRQSQCWMKWQRKTRHRASEMIGYEELKPRLTRSKFRSRFHLSEADRAYLAERGLSTIRGQAKKIIRDRLSAAHPFNDGAQTPMRGHAVFVAQHATGCCCRGCLAKWHGIPEGRELTEDEIESIADVIAGWLTDEAGDLSKIPHTPDLF